MGQDIHGIFKPESKTIREIFDGNGYYEIPDYQRPYSWVDDQIEQLWDDIYSAFESNDESYFLGPVILAQTNQDYFEVIDGQQRLTTLIILFCVLRDLYLTKISDKQVSNAISNAIKSFVDDKYRLRLITQDYYQNQFQQEILDKVKFPQTTLTKKERDKNRFINTALMFKEKLSEFKDVNKLKDFVNYLLNKVILITVTCSNRGFAIKLFQILNTRGLDLSNADLIKSFLLHRLEEKYGQTDTKERKQFKSTWGEIETINKRLQEIAEVELTDLFTYYAYYLLARNLKRSLYEELEAQFKDKDPNEIIYDFKRFVEFFDEIANEDSKLIYSFWYLPNQVFWRSVLTTAKMTDFNYFTELCQELRKLYYSYWIAGYNISRIKQLCFNIIGWIKSSRSINEIRKEIDKKIQEDSVVSRLKESLESDVYDKSWLKPLLILIEYEQTDNSKIEFIDPWDNRKDRKIHVDHILPQKWNTINYWKERWSENSANRWLDKIGNLTLLSGKKNIEASNQSFDKKKVIYKGGSFGGTTAFQITQHILDKNNWVESEVIERQNWLISQVKRILDIDF